MQLIRLCVVMISLKEMKSVIAAFQINVQGILRFSGDSSSSSISCEVKHFYFMINIYLK